MRFHLHHISHGAAETGGYLLEKTLVTALADELENCDTCYRETRFSRHFRGPFGWIMLAMKAFAAAGRHDNTVTVARLAWPVWLKLMTGRGKMLLVLHNYDPADGKPRLYYRLLNAFLRLAARRPDRIRVVTVAKYWQQFFASRFGLQPLYFPNLFDPAPYAFYAGVARKNSKLVHLGQYSAKMDRKAYLLLIHELKQRGYACYFSSNEPEFQSHFPVSFFSTREAYLKQMAVSGCTVILNSIDEGWNRVAHESMLVGTPVITRPGAGPEELVRTGGGHIAATVEEIIALLESGNLNPIDQTALQAFDIGRAAEYIQPIARFIRP